jgi:hypothetical protein
LPLRLLEGSVFPGSCTFFSRPFGSAGLPTPFEVDDEMEEASKAPHVDTADTLGDGGTSAVILVDGVAVTFMLACAASVAFLMSVCQRCERNSSQNKYAVRFFWAFWAQYHETKRDLQERGVSIQNLPRNLLEYLRGLSSWWKSWK